MSHNRDGDAAFVEVLAEAALDQPIECYVADVELRVRGTSGDSALQQVRALSDRCAARLIAAGMARDEIEDAGVSISSQWEQAQRDYTGKDATHRLRLRCAQLPRLTGAVSAVEGVVSSAAEARETISLEMRPPVFRDDLAQRADALRRALQAGREKAAAVAAEAGAALGPVLQLIEVPPAQRPSGFGDDIDWAGDSTRFGGVLTGGAGGGGGAAAETLSLSSPGRTIWIRCRVRFALV